VLEVTIAGDLDRKVRAMSTIIYNMGGERFGYRYHKENNRLQKTPSNNRREKRIKCIRAHLRKLTKVYKIAAEEEKRGLEELRNHNRERLTSCEEQRTTGEREERGSERELNSWKTHSSALRSNFLGYKRSGKLERSKEEVEGYLKQT
jgi:hypothetical protein